MTMIIDQHEDEEHDEADDDVALDHEAPERLDDVAGGALTFGPVQQNESRRRDVDAQAEQSRDQDDGRKGAELQRLLHEEPDQEDADRRRDTHRQEGVDEDRRHRQHHHQDDADDGERHNHVDRAVLRLLAGRGSSGCGSGRHRRRRSAISVPTSTL